WLQTCLAKHDARCNVKPVAVSASPARLLHLDIGSSKGNLRVVEVQDLPSMPVYLTLSYVWGSQKAVRLEMSNLEAMKAEIDLDSLPRTIRDAIIFTRALGYHYLWIDSLCIIQDSAADWATEAAKMGSIYWGSMLTLAALHASGSHEGLFSERNPLYDRPLRIPGTSFEITNTLNLGLAEPDSPQAPLQTRGWVVQERIMARRTLFFGSLGLFWECSCCAASESDVLGIRTRPDDDPSAPANFKLALHKALGDNANLMLSWSGIRSYYTKCNLTREKDRPIAISGLMNFIAAAGNAQHAHGMWLPFIVRELCWEVASIGQRPTEYESPSWSWMS
ncbi:HET-domain-containing protein, partial [Patellaria atrata CBS 101060]